MPKLNRPLITECRLLIDPPGPGPWNMAVDEVLLEWANEEGECCWRFYGWDRPTLSLGYFQEYFGRLEHAASGGCKAVRRLTGGGAILHDRELTYSLVLPGHHSLATRRDGLYGIIHTSLIDALAEFGVVAALHKAPPLNGSNGSSEYNDLPHSDQSQFLCFRRRSPDDVLVGGAKIAGSAQRRRRGAVLQHGSVLLRRCPAAPEVAGLAELTGKEIDAEQLARIWLPTLSRRLVGRWRHQPLSDRRRDLASKLAEARYASARWTECRQRNSAGVGLKLF